MSSFTEPVLNEAAWRKSRYSMANGNCVEVGSVADSIVVRDSANPSELTLGYSARAWQAFITATKTGNFDAASLGVR